MKGLEYKFFFNRHKLLDWYNLRFKYRRGFLIKTAKIHWFLPLFFLLFAAKQLILTPHDVHVKMEDILRTHATHHALSKDLVSRIVTNFLHELDPNYCYLIESEILKWTSPSPETLEQTLEQIQHKQFQAFEEMHNVMLHAISRRQAIEAQLATSALPEEVDPEEFKDMTWVKTEEDLVLRLKRIRSLQAKTAQRILNAEEQSHFYKRLDKRRCSREEEIKAPEMREHSVYTYFLKAMASALDSQTNYFTPAEANQLMMQVQQRLFGVGAQLRDDLNGFTILRILDGSPLSAHPEVEIGDRIIAVNHEPVIGLDITDAVELIRGPEGTEVVLTFLKQKEEAGKIDVNIVRGEIVLKESRFACTYEPFGNNVIGILQLHSFYQDAQSSSGSDLLQALEKLKKEHAVSGIILDLRGNTGGVLAQAVTVAGLFMHKGVVVSVKDNTGFIQKLRNFESKVAWDGPLIVLTDKLSASASEIVAQTLQEYGRGLVIGDPETFGKGTFQTFTLEAANYGKVNTKGEHKVTRGCYYTVSGKTPQKVGVKPSIVVPGHFSQLEIGERFAKYPLEPDVIEPSFEDDLSDIPMLHRYQISKLYKPGLQTVVTTYEPLLPALISNSTARLEYHLDYQTLLRVLSQKKPDSLSLGANDLQLEESINIMKDLIFTLEIYPSL